MRDRNCWVLRLVLCACMSWPTFSAAQEQPVPQDSSVGPLSAKELKKRDKKSMKELNLDDSNWLLNEVPDIITEAERRAFLELGTGDAGGKVFVGVRETPVMLFPNGIDR